MSYVHIHRIHTILTHTSAAKLRAPPTGSLGFATMVHILVNMAAFILHIFHGVCALFKLC